LGFGNPTLAGLAERRKASPARSFLRKERLFEKETMAEAQER
jgi:hypothetical protein